MKQVLCLLFFATFHIGFGSEDALTKMREQAKIRYQQSDQYKAIQREEFFQGELAARNAYSNQEREALAEILRLKNINSDILKFSEAFENEEKLKTFNRLCAEWQNEGADLSFEKWLLEKHIVVSSELKLLVQKFTAQKAHLGIFDFYHYVLMHMVFKKAHEFCDDWFVDITVLGVVTSYLSNDETQSFLLLAESIFKENEALKKQLDYWKRFYAHSKSSEKIIPFFDGIYSNPNAYHNFLTSVIDVELAKTLK